jgi:hypothetical protein
VNPWERDWNVAPAADTEKPAPWARDWSKQPKSWSAADEKPYNPIDDMSGGERFFAGVGKGMTDLARGVGQRVGLVDEKEVAEARARDKPLMDTGAGSAGEIAGKFAAMAPAIFVPGANTVAGAAVIGGASGFAEPTVKGESALKNAATGAVVGAGAQYGLGKAAEAATRKLAALRQSFAEMAAKNTVRDTAIRDAVDMGYKTTPSLSGGSWLGKTVEGLTGKEKATQMAAVKNQPVTDSIIRKNFGLVDDAPLSRDTLRAVRAKAVQSGYDPVRALPAVPTDDAFRETIGKLTSRADNAAKDFGALVDSDVKPFADGLSKVEAFSGDTAVDAISIFREKASDLYAGGNKTLGAAYRKAADAIEDQVERALELQHRLQSVSRGGSMNGPVDDAAKVLKDYRAARMKIAQTFDVEKALREGQGAVDARVLGKLFAKNPDRMTGDLAKVGKAAVNMGEAMAVPKSGWANQVTALDSGIGTIGSIFAGNPLPLAYPAARVGGRMALMSGKGQRAMALPDYNPGPIDRNAPILLEALRRRAAGASVGIGVADSE